MTRAPQRLQRQRAKGWRKPEGAVNVTRQSKWGNPYVLQRGKKDIWYIYADGQLHSHYGSESNPSLGRKWASEAAVEEYERDLRAGILPITVDDVRRELRGKDLLCWCGAEQACHADVLLRIANEATP